MAELRETMIQRRVRREVRSPRAAALAGIVFSILMSMEDIKRVKKFREFWN